MTDQGLPWTPIGQNDAITWPELHGLIGRRDLSAVERHLRRLSDTGITCLRLMLEYCENEECHLERPASRFRPSMVALWDDLVALCAQVGLRLLLTPFDTFFTWNNWANHPYNCANGGPCADRTQLLTCLRTRELIKARLAFASDRWGSTGVVFAWDLWNEMHPVQGQDHPDCFENFIGDVGPFLRNLEHRRYG
jgi:mannan endo-1,4-beta-mannosidase